MTKTGIKLAYLRIVKPKYISVEELMFNLKINCGAFVVPFKGIHFYKNGQSLFIQNIFKNEKKDTIFVVSSSCLKKEEIKNLLFNDKSIKLTTYYVGDIDSSNSFSVEDISYESVQKSYPEKSILTRNLYSMALNEKLYKKSLTQLWQERHPQN